MCQTKRLLFYPFLWVSILNYRDSLLSVCFFVVLQARFRPERGFNGVNLPPSGKRRNAVFVLWMGQLIGVAYGLGRPSAILKKGEGAMADDFLGRGCLVRWVEGWCPIGCFRICRGRLAIRGVWFLLFLRLIIRHLDWPKSAPDVFAEFALTRIKVCAREMKYFLS